MQARTELACTNLSRVCDEILAYLHARHTVCVHSCIISASKYDDTIDELVLALTIRTRNMRKSKHVLPVTTPLLRTRLHFARVIMFEPPLYAALHGYQVSAPYSWLGGSLLKTYSNMRDNMLMLKMVDEEGCVVNWIKETDIELRMNDEPKRFCMTQTVNTEYYMFVDNRKQYEGPIHVNLSVANVRFLPWQINSTA